MSLIETPDIDEEIVSSSVKQKSELNSTLAWKEYEKIIFRIVAVFLLLQIIPLDWKYYRDLFTRDWSTLHFSNFFYTARYAPRIFSDVPTYADWFVLLAVSVIAALVWGRLDKERKEYNTLYYWLRVIVRYRLAAGLIAYAFIKFFPQQMPYPSLSSLNTNYGDLTAWKIFSISTGIVPGYQSFLGLIELIPALLLLNRKTTVIGAFIILPFTGNVVLSNLAYEGGEYVYGSLLIVFAVFLVAYDAVRLYRFANELPVAPNQYKPELKESWQRTSRLVLKYGFIFVFVFFYGYKVRASYKDNGYHYPTAKGLPNAEGIYNVKEFTINKQTIAPSRIDAARWRDVVFEKWNTISIRSNEKVVKASALSEEIFFTDENRNYEYAGNEGRQFYSYEIDSANHVLKLINRNTQSHDYTFNYSNPDKKTFALSGVNSKNDSLTITLERIDKKYLLQEATKKGRRGGLKL